MSTPDKSPQAAAAAAAAAAVQPRAPPPPPRSNKKLVLWFACMFIVCSVLVLTAPAKEKVSDAAQHYHTLGLKPHASAGEVKKAYRSASFTARPTLALTR
jgi:hypothetical protein